MAPFPGDETEGTEQAAAAQSWAGDGPTASPPLGCCISGLCGFFDSSFLVGWFLMMGLWKQGYPQPTSCWKPVLWLSPVGKDAFLHSRTPTALAEQPSFGAATCNGSVPSHFLNHTFDK